MSQTPSGMMVHKMADVAVIEFMDSNLLDQVQIEKVRRDIDDLVERMAVPKLVISFEDVQHISSAVLGILMSVDKKAKSKKGQLRLAHLNANIRPVFQLTKLDKVLKIFNTTDEALKGL